MTHLSEAEFEGWLSRLNPGANVHLERTRITEESLNRIKRAVEDKSGRPFFGLLSLTHAVIDGSVDLRYARFKEILEFRRIEVSSYVDLEGVRLERGLKASFAKAPNGIDFYRAEVGGDLDLEGSEIGDRLRIARCKIGGSLLLRGCEVDGYVECYELKVSGPAYASNMKVTEGISFRDSSFAGGGQFFYTETREGGFDISDSRFSRLVEFEGLRVANDLVWEGAIFDGDVTFDKAELSGFIGGACLFSKSVSFVRTTFRSPVSIQACAGYIDLGEARFETGATLLIRYAAVRMTGAALAGPTILASFNRMFQDAFGNTLDESAMVGASAGVKLLGLGSVDARNLTLVDIDLTLCRFAGAFNLDQLRLEGRWAFNKPPSGRVGISPFVWTNRQIIEEERRWRALHSHPRLLPNSWENSSDSEHDVPSFASLMTIYRQLRKCREDAKDEPGANDFYYGEMEMRRHSQDWRKIERWLLQAYWLLSGYGLRASRAIGWLFAAMILTIILMMGFGLPRAAPKQEAVGTVPSGGGKVTFEIDKEGPRNPTGDRFTTKRFDKSLNMTFNSVVFRSSGQDLTTAGTYIEMASRFFEPILLGLGVLAIRGRLKRN